MESRPLTSMTKDELIAELEQLRITENQYRTLLDNSSDAIFSFDKSGQYLYVNKEFAKNVCDKKPDYIIGKKLWDIFSKEEADKRYALIKWVFANGESRNIEVRVPGKNGDNYHLTTVKPILDQQENVIFVICISKNITERKLMEEQLKHSAHYDSLTDLPNRILFSDHTKYAIAQAERHKTKFAIMYIDLDNFKPVNDTHGHDVGDLILKAVAKRIQDCLRKSDTAGRIGGDEFIVLLPKIDNQKDTLNVAEKIRFSLNQPFELHGYPAIHISSSIGIAIYPEHGCDEIQLSKNADNAMYFAKKGGRNMTKVFQFID
jgi:diguanylate cyclase (GGDEF)-like protein/PAS domain S-box-containing protein